MWSCILQLPVSILAGLLHPLSIVIYSNFQMNVRLLLDLGLDAFSDFVLVYLPFLMIVTHSVVFNPLNAKLNPICHLLALLGAHHILHVRIRVNL